MVVYEFGCFDWSYVTWTIVLGKTLSAFSMVNVNRNVITGRE